MTVEITKSVVDHLVSRLESLSLDSPLVRPSLHHDDGTRPETDTRALDTDFRKFRITFPARAVPTPQHVGTSEYHPRLWDLTMGLEVVYPFGAAGNQIRVAGIAIDDQMRIVHHLEVDHTRVTVADQYEWVGVLVEAQDVTAAADRIRSTFTITAKIQRAF